MEIIVKGIVSKMVKPGMCWVVIAVVLLSVIAGGCSSVTSSESDNMPPTTAVEVSIGVIDAFNNTPVAGVPVYFIACSPRGNDTRAFNASQVTDNSGWARFSANYTLEKGDIIYLGASNDQYALVADFNSMNFNGPGNIGLWKSFSYEMIGGGQENSSITCIIRIDRDTGKMMD